MWGRPGRGGEEQNEITEREKMQTYKTDRLSVGDQGVFLDDLLGTLGTPSKVFYAIKGSEGGEGLLWRLDQLKTHSRDQKGFYDLKTELKSDTQTSAELSSLIKRIWGDKQHDGLQNSRERLVVEEAIDELVRLLGATVSELEEMNWQGWDPDSMQPQGRRAKEEREKGNE